MTSLKVMGAALAAVMLATSVQAMTITNRDASEITVVIQKGDDAKEHVLAAGATVQDECDQGCSLRLADGDAIEAQADDKFVVSGGQLKRNAE